MDFENIIQRLVSNNGNIKKLVFESTDIFLHRDSMYLFLLNYTINNLTLKCCCITDKHCKLLSENTSIQILNVKINEITYVGAKYLAKMNLIKLKISDNKIGNAGINALIKNKKIIHLSAKYNKIKDAGLKNIHNNYSLEILKLDDNKIKCNGSKFLANNKSIYKLSLAYNKIKSKGLNYFGKNTSIKKLYIQGNFIDDTCIAKFCMNTTLDKLNISNNYLNNDNVIKLSKMNLKKLYINDNEFTTSGAIALAKNNTIHTLDVSDNALGDLGIYELLCNKTLKLLSITCELLFDNFSYLTNNILVELHIYNSVCNMNLMNYLKQNKTITCLVINNSSNKLTSDMIETLAQNTSITDLELSMNKISDIRSIATNNKINTLNLDWCEIEISYVDTLMKMKKLKSISLSYNTLTLSDYTSLASNKLLETIMVKGESTNVNYIFPFLCNYTVNNFDFTLLIFDNMVFKDTYNIIEKVNNRINTNRHNDIIRNSYLIELLLS